MFGSLGIKIALAAVILIALAGAAFAYRADLIEYGGAVVAAKANAAAVKQLAEDVKRANDASEDYQRKLAELQGKQAEKVVVLQRIADNTVCGGTATRCSVTGLLADCGNDPSAARANPGGPKATVPHK